MICFVFLQDRNRDDAQAAGERWRQSEDKHGTEMSFSNIPYDLIYLLNMTCLCSPAWIQNALLYKAEDGIALQN